MIKYAYVADLLIIVSKPYRLLGPQVAIISLISKYGFIKALSPYI